MARPRGTDTVVRSLVFVTDQHGRAGHTTGGGLRGHHSVESATDLPLYAPLSPARTSPVPEVGADRTRRTAADERLHPCAQFAVRSEAGPAQAAGVE